jgi:hypothetical protein
MYYQAEFHFAPKVNHIFCRENVMSKSQRSNREVKKQALHTPKEKKLAKRLKKHAGDPSPFIVREP